MPALDTNDLAVARTLLKDGNLTVAEVADRLGVAPSTLYAHLPLSRPLNLLIGCPARLRWRGPWVRKAGSWHAKHTRTSRAE